MAVRGNINSPWITHRIVIEPAVEVKNSPHYIPDSTSVHDLCNMARHAALIANLAIISAIARSRDNV